MPHGAPFSVPRPQCLGFSSQLELCQCTPPHSQHNPHRASTHTGTPSLSGPRAFVMVQTMICRGDFSKRRGLSIHVRADVKSQYAASHLSYCLMSLSANSMCSFLIVRTFCCAQDAELWHAGMSAMKWVCLHNRVGFPRAEASCFSTSDRSQNWLKTQARSTVAHPIQSIWIYSKPLADLKGENRHQQTIRSHQLAQQVPHPTRNGPYTDS